MSMKQAYGCPRQLRTWIILQVLPQKQSEMSKRCDLSAPIQVLWFIIIVIRLHRFLFGVWRSNCRKTWGSRVSGDYIKRLSRYLIVEQWIKLLKFGVKVDLQLHFRLLTSRLVYRVVTVVSEHSKVVPYDTYPSNKFKFCHVAILSFLLFSLCCTIQPTLILQRHFWFLQELPTKFKTRERCCYS